jgi:hypothetical protein
MDALCGEHNHAHPFRVQILLVRKSEFNLKEHKADKKSYQRRI